MIRTIFLTILAVMALIAAETPPTVAPAPEASPVAESPKPAGKPKTHRWVEGPLVRLFAIQANSNGAKLTGWPPAALPDAPLAVLTDIAEIPQVLKAGPQKAGAEAGKPNRLLPLSVAPQLQGQLYYAVEYEGCFWAETSGKYGISVTSDDPTEILWQPVADEGWKSLAKTQHSISLETSEWNQNTTAWKFGLGTNIGVITQSLPKELDTITAALPVPSDRVYVPIRIRAYQRWLPRPAEMAAKAGDVDQDALWCQYAGARFTLSFTTPEGQDDFRVYRKERIIPLKSTRPTEE